MTFRTLLYEITQLFDASTRLEPEVVADARREARLLIAGVLGLSPWELALRMDRELNTADRGRISTAAERRARGEPLAYCVGGAPFRELWLTVDARVLIPRPETEVVVGEALRLTETRAGGVAVDIGTGSGAIALSLATEGQFERVIGTDISEDALDVARHNAMQLSIGTRPIKPILEWRSGVDLAPINGLLARVIVANPPYISYAEAAALPASVRDWEPSAALFAANDGMARYDVLLHGAARCLEPDGWLVLEVDATRARETARRAVEQAFSHVALVQDLSGRDRVLVAQRSSQQSGGNGAAFTLN